MRFVLPAHDHDFALGLDSGAVNGGTVYLFHLAQALKALGHQICMVALGDTHTKGDVMICQSEWANHQTWKAFNGIKVCILGHFIDTVHEDPKTIQAHVFISTWKGAIVEGYSTTYLPHAYAKTVDNGKITRRGSMVWLGNNYALRDQGWLQGLSLTLLKAIHPRELAGIYRGADVCPNIHGDFQKGLVSTDPSTLANSSGFALNERFFNIIGAGGVMVTDKHPLNKEIFEEDELLSAGSKEEFQELLQYYMHHPIEGKKFYARARKKILTHNTYIHRAKQLLNLIT